MNTRRTTIVATLLAATLAVPAAASAHVTLQPRTATAGAYTVLSVRVPNESDSAATTKVAVELPHGFASASYQAVPGWKVTMKRGKADEPTTTDDGVIDDEVHEITFAADGDGIAPGQFQDFPLSVKLPDRARTLTFKAVQTYSDGEVVRWIGAEDSDHPAPTVQLTAAGGGATAPAATTVEAGASKGLGIAALVVGIVAALLAAASLIRRRA